MSSPLDRVFALALSMTLSAFVAGGCQSGAGETQGQPDASGATGGSGGTDASGGATGGTSAAGGEPVAGTTGGVIGTGGSRPGSDASAADATPGPDLRPAEDLTANAEVAPLVWPQPFDPKCTPPTVNGRAQAEGHHNAGQDCMTSGCHFNPKPAHHYPGTNCSNTACHYEGSPDGSGAPAFLFGGTVYRAATLVPDPGVEIAVEDPHGFYSTCSAANGNFWYVASSDTVSVNWLAARTRLRNANGGLAMVAAPAAGCNAATCHTKDQLITSP